MRWQCRRGQRELDLILTRYLEGPFATASRDEQEAFERLLERPDPVLRSWLLLEEPATLDPAEKRVLADLKVFRGG